MPDITQQLEAAEQAITTQLDRVYALVRAGDPQSLIEVEYRRAVERITAKYQLLLTMAAQQTDQLSAEQIAERTAALQSQYQQDIVFLAAALDDALKTRQSATPRT